MTSKARDINWPLCTLVIFLGGTILLDEGVASCTGGIVVLYLSLIKLESNMGLKYIRISNIRKYSDSHILIYLYFHV
jgi:uncharacterized membrane protein